MTDTEDVKLKSWPSQMLVKLIDKAQSIETFDGIKLFIGIG